MGIFERFWGGSEPKDAAKPEGSFGEGEGTELDRELREKEIIFDNIKVGVRAKFGDIRAKAVGTEEMLPSSRGQVIEDRETLEAIKVDKLEPVADKENGKNDVILEKEVLWGPDKFTGLMKTKHYKKVRGAHYES